MRRWKIVVILLSCLALVGLVACSPSQGSDEEEFAGQLVEVVRGDLVVSVSGSGFIEVSHEANLSFDNGGEVRWIFVEEGDEVGEGELLASLGPLDREVLQIAVTQAEATLLQAEYNLDQVEHPFTEEEIEDAEEAVEDAEDFLDLADDMLRYVLRHGSQWEVIQWQMEVFRAESSLQLAEDTLEDMLDAVDEDQVAILGKQVTAAEQALEEARRALAIEILTAPFNGVVASVNVEEGDVIPPPSVAQVPVIRLIDLTTMELIVELDEIDVPGVKRGQKAMVTIDALPDLVLEGEVISVSPVATLEAGLVLYDVKVGFNITDGSGVKVGMSATADIVLADRSDVLLVPDRAINYDRDGGAFVYVMVSEEEIMIEDRAVVVGVSDGFLTEIEAGLEEGEIVAIEIQPRQDALERLGFPPH